MIALGRAAGSHKCIGPLLIQFFDLSHITVAVDVLKFGLAYVVSILLLQVVPRTPVKIAARLVGVAGNVLI